MAAPDGEHVANLVAELVRKKKMGTELPKATATAMSVTAKESGMVDLTKLMDGNTATTVLVDCRDMSTIIVNVSVAQRPSMITQFLSWFTAMTEITK